MSRYQTFWWRVLAAYIDGLVFAPIQLADHFVKVAGRSHPTLIAWLVISFLVPWLYNVLMHARFGQTVGKMIARIKVLDVSEERLPTIQQAYLREIGTLIFGVLGLGYVIHSITLGTYDPSAELAGLPGDIRDYAFLAWFLLEVFTMWTNDKRRALHDYIAETVVVNVERARVAGLP